MADEQKLPYHRLYRPVSFDEYLGNAQLKTTLFATLKKDPKPQVILLYGDSGCGKTSMARLIAQEYSCAHRDLEKGACGTCQSCLNIRDYIRTGDSGILGNIKEVNVSDQNGKNSLNWVLEDMQIPAYDNDWKVYIFDECHKATDALQNAMLKSLEEPPENVLMIFCTTRPEEMIDTFINRCQLKLKVQKPTEDELVGLLKKICEKEGVDYNTKGLKFIANRSELTFRTALTLLEQIVNQENSATYDSVIKVLDALSDVYIIDFFKSLKAKDTLKYVTNLVKIKDKVELPKFLEQLKSFVKRGIYTINGIDVPGVTKNDLAIYTELFGHLGVMQVGLLLNKLLTFNERNLELELLLWGYTGLDELSNTVNNVNDVLAQGLESELQQEQANASKELKAHQEVDYQQGVENASKMMEPATMDDLLKMCGTLAN